MLHLRLLGTPAITLDGRALPGLTNSPILISTLAYLVIHRDRPHARSVLAALIWSDLPEARARRYLNTHIWRLRRMLKVEPAISYVCTADKTIQFNPAAPFWLDVNEFEQATGDLVAVPPAPSPPLQHLRQGRLQREGRIRSVAWKRRWL